MVCALSFWKFSVPFLTFGVARWLQVSQSANLCLQSIVMTLISTVLMQVLSFNIRYLVRKTSCLTETNYQGSTVVPSPWYCISVKQSLLLNSYVGSHALIASSTCKLLTIFLSNLLGSVTLCLYLLPQLVCIANPISSFETCSSELQNKKKKNSRCLLGCVPDHFGDDVMARVN